MKAPPFEYARPAAIEDVIRQLPRHVMLIAALWGGPATAGESSLPPDIQPSFDMRLLGLAPVEDSAIRCWQRRFGAGSPAVRSDAGRQGVALCIRVERIVPEDPPLVTGAIVRYRYNFHLTARLPRGGRPLHMIGECGWAYAPEDVEHAGGRKTHCMVDCDGGGIEIEPAGSGGLLLLRLDERRSAGGCSSDLGKEHAKQLARGWNGGFFLLHRIGIASYRAFAGETELYRDLPLRP